MNTIKGWALDLLSEILSNEGLSSYLRERGVEYLASLQLSICNDQKIQCNHDLAAYEPEFTDAQNKFIESFNVFKKAFEQNANKEIKSCSFDEVIGIIQKDLSLKRYLSDMENIFQDEYFPARDTYEYYQECLKTINDDISALRQVNITKRNKPVNDRVNMILKINNITQIESSVENDTTDEEREDLLEQMKKNKPNKKKSGESFKNDAFTEMFKQLLEGKDIGNSGLKSVSNTIPKQTNNNIIKEATGMIAS